MSVCILAGSFFVFSLVSEMIGAIKRFIVCCCTFAFKDVKLRTNRADGVQTQKLILCRRSSTLFMICALVSSRRLFPSRDCLFFMFTHDACHLSSSCCR